MDELKPLLKRIVIKDMRELPEEYDAAYLRALIERNKLQTGAKKAFVAVDYLQILPFSVQDRRVPEQNRSNWCATP